jgi:hypothetical protein
MSLLEKLMEEIERVSGTHKVPVPFNVDDAGYLDRLCPNAPCGRGFKVLLADKDKFGDEGWCVYCGHKNVNLSFATEDQASHAAAVAHDHAAQLFDNALRNVANASPTSRTSGGKYFSVTITESMTAPPERSIPERTPPQAWEVMRLEASCRQCGCRFASIGGCFFCPACGYRSADTTFEETLRRIRDGFSKQRQLEAAVGSDCANDMLRKMAESDVQTLVTAFEAFAKDSFDRLAPGAPLPSRNVFQNLARGGELWVLHGGSAFDAILSSSEHAELARFFQQRHVLAHCNGIVDAAYRTNTGDTTYELGQRLAIKPEHALRMAELVEKLVTALRGDVP